MSSLLHPLQAASQKCRPKHQVLILRCYPQYQKNVQEIKPNSSELSYLLYYASTRRSKLPKVGAFLEKKSANDVWRQRLGNVQVTLQILTAIIEKTPRDISLYASSVLTIIDNVLQSKDLNMVEETLPTFEAYCKYVDTPSLLADQTRAKQYLSIVQTYAGFASREQSNKGRPLLSIPQSIRWRTLSLRAIRAVVGSEAITADSSTQLNAVMPVILENLALEDDQVLDVLQEKAQTSEKQSTEMARKRRMSIATVTTVDTTDANPAMASETTADADKAAEDEVRVFAVRCLKQIFSISTASTRGQTRLATALTLRFIASEYRSQQSVEEELPFEDTWAAALFEAIARWTPVQDRFVIVLTAMETLVRSPIVEVVLEKQLILSQMIDHLLRSDVNLIGLSVMDVLLGLVQHTLLLLQLGGKDSSFVPQLPGDASGIFNDVKKTFDAGDEIIQSDVKRTNSSDEVTPSPLRKKLLGVLETCISDLGNHLYYTDQISDMITAILARLKPSMNTEIASIAAAINNPSAASKAIADSASLQEDPSTDSFFSFATARVIALRAVKDILITANARKAKTGASAESRSRVGVHVWEGTQWLLKDDDQNVRFAYADALLTWLRLETNKSNLLLPQDGSKNNRLSKKLEGQNGESKLTKRAISSASRKEQKKPKSAFYQLLHLAIYDNALNFAEQDQEILLLYLLMSTLIERLGVNAVRTGLPMIMQLQNTALNDENTTSPRSKVNLASLVHGYLRSITEKFTLESTKPGNEILSQIAKRRQLGVWLEGVQVPAISSEQIRQTQGSESPAGMSDDTVGSMKPFLDVDAFINHIADAYDDSLLSPPGSPSLSPVRLFSVPTLGFGYGYSSAPPAKPAHRDQMPQNIKDEMRGLWSRENCVASIDKEGSASLAGSRTGNSSAKNHLAINAANGDINGRESPASPMDATYQTHQLGNGLGSFSKHRHGTWSGSAIHLTNSSSHESTIKVSDLKRALSGVNINSRNESPLRRPFTTSRRSFRESEDGSESMLSWNDVDDLDGSVTGGHSSRPGTSNQRKTVDRAYNSNPSDTQGDIPPVPKIPSILNLPGTWPRDASPKRVNGEAHSVAPANADSGNKHIIISSNTHSEDTNQAFYKQSSRPTSKAGANSLRSQTYTISSTDPASVKNAIVGFLAGIETEVSSDGIEMNRDHSKKRLVSPPY